MAEFDYIKIKNFSLRDTIKRVKKQGTEQGTEKVTNAYIHTL